MRTLYEKLSKEQLAKLDANSERYPAITTMLINTLEENFYLTELSVEVAFNLHEILVGGVFGISKYMSIADEFIKEV